MSLNKITVLAIFLAIVLTAYSPPLTDTADISHRQEDEETENTGENNEPNTERATEPKAEGKAKVDKPLPSRPTEHKRTVYEVTAYTAGYECTGKRPGDKGYGITASGAKVRERHTIAAPKDIPFGTKIYIPYFDATFTVEDRGGAIKGKRLDVYIDDLSEAKAFGRRKLDVHILN